MEKSLGRAFLFSFIFVIALSFLFYIIGYSVLGTLDHRISDASSHPSIIVLWFTSPYTWFPWELITEAIAANPSTQMGLIILYVGFLLALIVGAIVAAIFGGDFSNSLGGWVLTSIVCIIAILVIIFIDPFNIDRICYNCEMSNTIIQVIITGFVNLLIFGGITLLTVLIVGSYGK